MELTREIPDLYSTWVWVRVRKRFITSTSWVWVRFGARSTILSMSSYSKSFKTLGPVYFVTMKLKLLNMSLHLVPLLYMYHYGIISVHNVVSRRVGFNFTNILFREVPLSKTDQIIYFLKFSMWNNIFNKILLFFRDYCIIWALDMKFKECVS